MKRGASFRTLVGGLVVVSMLGACNKPTPESCEKALHNIAVMLGTDNLDTPAEFQGEVRRCRGGSTKEAVDCAIKATTLDELAKCDFEKTAPHKLASPGSAGSASGSAK
ncbi:MAG TPA: hypothetical protein VH143_07945 [Kofleriaceae bacterium]|jgi:hypothetical protein|nr:hypothetical protein [Kofleriaceae bacterium]